MDLPSLVSDFFYNSEFRGGFWGAFFAFIFLLISTFFGNFLKRRRSCLSNLIKLQLELVSIHEHLRWNIEEFDRFLNWIKRATDDLDVPEYFYQPHLIHPDKTLVAEIANGELLNSSISFFNQLEVANNGLVSTKECSHVLMKKEVPLEKFPVYLSNLQRHLEFQKKQFSTAQDMCEELLAHARALYQPSCFQKLLAFAFKAPSVQSGKWKKRYESELEQVRAEFRKSDDLHRQAADSSSSQ